jgi:hypothetical protein
MNPYEMFETDSGKERKGVEIDYGSFRVTITRAGGSNKAYQSALKRRMDPHKRAVQNGTISDEFAERLLNEVYADSIITNWDSLVETGELDEESGNPVTEWKNGIVNRAGELLEFNWENVVHTLCDLPDLARDLRGQAADMALFKRQNDEQAGNA